NAAASEGLKLHLMNPSIRSKNAALRARKKRNSPANATKAKANTVDPALITSGGAHGWRKPISQIRSEAATVREGHLKTVAFLVRFRQPPDQVPLLDWRRSPARLSRQSGCDPPKAPILRSNRGNRRKSPHRHFLRT